MGVDDVAKVKQKTDIVELIESYIPLKKAGRNFKTPCPFHSEKSPSFVVSPDRQIWHCFGCNKGGDVFTFVEEYEKTTFADALKFLAQKAGVKLTTSAARSEIERKRDLLYSLNLLAAQYYEYILFSHSVGKQALEYVTKKRHQKEALLKTFQVGYAPNTGDSLAKFLLSKKKYQPQDLVDAGLAFRQGTRVIDFFRHRIMFPITDPRGNIIAFSGRSLSSDQMPKYVNTKETMLYKKGETVFGLNLARDEIKKEGAVIIMEGEFDVISAHREGIGNVVAVKGTALTPEQIDLLKRYAQKLVFCFDTDPAGTSAQRRSIQMIENAGIVASVIVLPTGKDPDELLSSDPIAFKQALKKDVHIYDFIIDSAVAQSDPQSADGKRAILEKTIPYLSVIDNQVIKEHYLKKLAVALDTSFDAVLRQAEKEKSAKVTKTLPIDLKKKTREDVISVYLFALILQSPHMLEAIRTVDSIISDVAWVMPVYQKLFLRLKTHAEKGGVFEPVDFSRNLPPELTEAYDTAYLFPIQEFSEKDFTYELKKTAIEEKSLAIKKRITQIASELVEAERARDTKKVDMLQSEVAHLTGKIQENGAA
ncbi:MAG TPA: DNA primase [Candidatus Levybacteria bacterium]|nr:DNA primase [Candidatus Levybacteria bacterium]